MASPHYWTSTFQVGGHHLARAFVAEGWDVAYITTPLSPLHVAQGLSDQLRDRWGIYRRGGITDLDGHLWSYVPGALATPFNAPLLRSRFVHRNWHRLTWPRLVKGVQRRGFGAPDVIFIDSVIQRFWLEALPHRRSVQRIADRVAGFPQFTSAMHEMEGEVAREVDLVAYTAHSLAPHIDSLRPRRSIHLPNGVDVDHFAHGDQSLPDDLRNIPRPIALYVGAMDAWFDYATVDRLTAALPEVSFVLIGPDELAQERLARQPNLYLLGRRPYASLPGYLANADVGLIPFDAIGHAELVRSIHPLKLYEYLAAGLPVVATRWEEIATLGSPATLCRTADECVFAVRRAIESPPDRAAGQAFAAAATWRSRVRTLIEALDL